MCCLKIRIESLRRIHVRQRTSLSAARAPNTPSPALVMSDRLSAESSGSGKVFQDSNLLNLGATQIGRCDADGAIGRSAPFFRATIRQASSLVRSRSLSERVVGGAGSARNHPSDN